MEEAALILTPGVAEHLEASQDPPLARVSANGQTLKMALHATGVRHSSARRQTTDAINTVRPSGTRVLAQPRRKLTIAQSSTRPVAVSRFLEPRTCFVRVRSVDPQILETQGRALVIVKIRTASARLGQEWANAVAIRITCVSIVKGLAMRVLARIAIRKDHRSRIAGITMRSSAHCGQPAVSAREIPRTWTPIVNALVADASEL